MDFASKSKVQQSSPMSQRLRKSACVVSRNWFSGEMKDGESSREANLTHGRRLEIFLRKPNLICSCGWNDLHLDFKLLG